MSKGKQEKVWSCEERKTELMISRSDASCKALINVWFCLLGNTVWKTNLITANKAALCWKPQDRLPLAHGWQEEYGAVRKHNEDWWEWGGRFVLRCPNWTNWLNQINAGSLHLFIFLLNFFSSKTSPNSIEFPLDYSFIYLFSIYQINSFLQDPFFPVD